MKEHYSMCQCLQQWGIFFTPVRVKASKAQKHTGVIDDIKSNFTVFQKAGSRVLVLGMLVHWHGLLGQMMELMTLTLPGNQRKGIFTKNVRLSFQRLWGTRKFNCSYLKPNHQKSNSASGLSSEKHRIALRLLCGVFEVTHYKRQQTFWLSLRTQLLNLWLRLEREKEMLKDRHKKQWLRMQKQLRSKSNKWRMKSKHISDSWSFKNSQRKKSCWSQVLTWNSFLRKRGPWRLLNLNSNW